MKTPSAGGVSVAAEGFRCEREAGVLLSGCVKLFHSAAAASFTGLFPLSTPPAAIFLLCLLLQQTPVVQILQELHPAGAVMLLQRVFIYSHTH